MSSPAPSRPGPSHVSPRTARSTGDNYVQTSNCIEIGSETNTEILVCPIASFQNTYLPFVPAEDDISACLQKLGKAALLVEDSAGTLSWADFPTPPSQDSDTEQDVFSALQDIANEVATYTFPSGTAPNRYNTPRLRYRDRPYTTVASEIKGSNFKIDGCFTLNKASNIFASSNDLLAPDLAVVTEYKKYQKDRADNHLKVVSAASHVMNDDPRRAFMFGITIEDTMMSLWYFSHSHSTKSVQFDFIKDPRLLVSIFLSFLFGTEEGLGYDPDVRRCGGTPIYYEYKISGKHDTRYYRTCGALSSYRSLGITSRMTRVWRAIQISGFGGGILPGKTAVALKDVWLDNDARTEGWIQQEIFRAVDSERRKHAKNLESRLDLIKSWDRPARGGSVFDIICNGEYRKYFLEIDFDGQGVSTKAKPLDAQPTLGLFAQDKKKSLDSRSKQIPESDRSRSTGSHIRPSHLKSEVVIDEEVYRKRRYVPKRRYLLIFNNICTALHDMTDLGESFLVLHDALFALAVMFVANWVHRDVSSGNILSLGKGNSVRGKLSDLEYAKPFMADSPHSVDPKTGTPFFMAYELLSRRPIYEETLPEPVRDFTKLLAALNQPPPSESTATPTLTPPEASNVQPVIYNFEHDVESLWWISLWILLARIAHEASQQYAKTFYINRLGCPEERGLVFIHNGHLIEKLKKKMFSNLHGFIDTLDGWRISLVQSYRSRERKLGDPQTYSALYPKVMYDLFACYVTASRIQNCPSLVNLHPRPLPISEHFEPTEGDASSAASSILGKRPHSTNTTVESSSKVARRDNEQEPSNLDLHPDRRLFQ